jgi:hypothetical protein
MNPAKRENQVENVLEFDRSFRASLGFALHDVNVPENEGPCRDGYRNNVMYVRTYSTATVQAHTDWSPGGPDHRLCSIMV